MITIYCFYYIYNKSGIYLYGSNLDPRINKVGQHIRYYGSNLTHGSKIDPFRYIPLYSTSGSG